MSIEEGRLLADIGMERAREAKKIWVNMANNALDLLLRSDQPFTSDDLIALAGLPSNALGGNKCVGAVINAAARRKLIVRVGFTPTKRTTSHARLISKWRRA